MQTYARQHKLPLDVMKFRTDVTTKSVEQITEAAPVGCYIHGEQLQQYDLFWTCKVTVAKAQVAHIALLLGAGLCLEGARWDKEDGVLKDSLPNQLHPALPVLQVCFA